MYGEPLDAANRGGAMYVSGVTTDTRLHSVVFRDNEASGQLGGNDGLRRGGAISLVDAQARFEIANGLFHDNQAPNGGAIYVQVNTVGVGGLDLINCTLSQNATKSFGVGGGTGARGGCLFYTFGGRDHSIQNSIIYANNSTPNNPEAIWVDSGPAIPADDSLIQADSMASVSGTTIDFVNDPLFVDPSLDDFQLATGSPCIDEGEDGWLPMDDTDLDGDGVTGVPIPWALKKNQLRVYSSQLPPAQALVDMGAHERGQLGIQ